MQTVLLAFLIVLSILFPIWVAVHSWRKGYKSLAITLSVSFLIPFIPLLFSLPAFFIVKPYQPNLGYLPNPWSFVGCGTRFYGVTNRQPDGSFVTTEWFSLFYIPLVPIQSYQVIHLGNMPDFEGTVLATTSDYSILKCLNLDYRHVLMVYGFMLSFIIVLVLLNVTSSSNDFITNGFIALVIMYVFIGVRWLRAK